MEFWEVQTGKLVISIYCVIMKFKLSRNAIKFANLKSLDRIVHDVCFSLDKLFA